MHEIILTFRPDFQESSLGKYETKDEAQEIARSFAALHNDRIVRAWVRKVQNSETKPASNPNPNQS